MNEEAKKALREWHQAAIEYIPVYAHLPRGQTMTQTLLYSTTLLDGMYICTNEILKMYIGTFGLSGGGSRE